MDNSLKLLGACAATLGAVTLGVLLPVDSSNPAPRPFTQQSHTSTTQPQVPHWMTVSCKREDSMNCFWDASRKGNHVGQSFYVRAMPHVKGYKHPMVCVFYVHKPAWDYCNQE
jgi:hypothetical protein